MRLAAQTDSTPTEPFSLVAPLADFAALNTSWGNATGLNSTWGNSSWSGNGTNATRFILIDGASFFDSVNGVSPTLLRLALSSASATAGADLRVVDLWVTTHLRVAGLTEAGASSVGFQDALAASATAAVLASAAGIDANRLSLDGFAFEDGDSWTVTVTLRGFEGHVAAVNAAAQTMQQPATVAAVAATLRSFLCSADGRTCLDLDVALAGLTVSAVASAKPRPAPPAPSPPPPGQAPMTDNPDLISTLGLVISGFGAFAKRLRRFLPLSRLRSRLRVCGLSDAPLFPLSSTQHT